MFCMRRRKSFETRMLSILLVATLLMTAGCGREEQSEGYRADVRK